MDASTTATDSESVGGLVILGYVTAVLIPIVGFVLGLVAVTRSDRRTAKHGVWIIVVSIVAFIVAVAIITSSVSHEITRAQQTFGTELRHNEETARTEEREIEQKATQESREAQTKLTEEEHAAEARATEELRAAEGQPSSGP